MAKTRIYGSGEESIKFLTSSKLQVYIKKCSLLYSIAEDKSDRLYEKLINNRIERMATPKIEDMIGTLENTDFLVFIGTLPSSKLSKDQEALVIKIDMDTPMEEIVKDINAMGIIQEYDPSNWFMLRRDCLQTGRIDILADVSVSAYTRASGGSVPIMWVCDINDISNLSGKYILKSAEKLSNRAEDSIQGNTSYLDVDSINKIFLDIKEQYPSPETEEEDRIANIGISTDLGFLDKQFKFALVFNKKYLGYNGQIDGSFAMYPVVAKIYSLCSENVKTKMSKYLKMEYDEFHMLKETKGQEEQQVTNKLEKSILEIKRNETREGSGMLPLTEMLGNTKIYKLQGEEGL